MPVKIQFADMDKEYDLKNNVFTKVLNQYFGGYEISDKPDFLIYNSFGINHLKYDNCVKIFFTSEAVTPDFNECDYGIGFDWIQFGDRYHRRPVWTGEERYFNNYYDITDEEALSRRFCNFVYYNNNSGRGAEFRQRFVKELSKYKRVDCPGKY